jgi:hypothetical protein
VPAGSRVNTIRSLKAEALGRLVNEGLVDVILRSGYRVRQLTLRDVDEIFECCRIVWPAIAVLAAQRITPAERQAMHALERGKSDNEGIETARRLTEFVVAAARNPASGGDRGAVDRGPGAALPPGAAADRRARAVRRARGPVVQRVRRPGRVGHPRRHRGWIDEAYANVLAAVCQLESVRNTPLI